MPQIFESLRIVDLTQGMAGSLATMIFADYGAEVIRIEPPGGDHMWEHPAYRLWQRGKKSVAPDWDSERDRSTIRALVTGADIFLESLGPGKAALLGLDPDALSKANPALIQYSLSAFGETGPYRDYPASDGLVNAKCGRMRDQVGWQKNRPTYRAINDLSYHTAMFAVQAIIAALRVRLVCGRGQRLSGTLLSGAAAPNNNWRLFEGQPVPEIDLYPGEQPHDVVLRGDLVPDRREADPYTAIPSQLCIPCKDDRWIMHSHLQPELFRAWVTAIGLGWVLDDPRWKDAPRIADDADRIALNLMLFERLREKTSLEWREIYRANPDCAGEIMQTTQEAIHHEQFLANGHLVTVEDPEVGPMRQIGPFARMEQTPARIGRPAPRPGEHTSEVMQEQGQRPSAPASFGKDGTLPQYPLEGITVVEAASWLAAPFSGTLLADLGATVIKVEPLSGDPYRKMITNENMIRSFQGKKNIAVDLKTPEGFAVFEDLIRTADIFMHNMRPGAPERLGIDYESLRRIKPDLVYVYAGSYGSRGPDRARAAFNPTMGAFSGNSVFQSGEGNNPKGDQSPDPIAGSGVATGMMLGLAARMLTGQGQYVETSMMNSNVYCNSDDAFDYAGKPPRMAPDKDQLGLEATYRLYPARNGWVFLAARFDPEFAALCAALERTDLVRDDRFATWQARRAHSAQLGDILAGIFATHDAETWERDLSSRGVGCVQADAMGHKRFLHLDPQPAATGFMTIAASAEFEDVAPGGRYWRHAPVVGFSLTPCAAGKPYEGMGSHTREVLENLGYDPARIDWLAAKGCIALDRRETLKAGAG